MFCMNCGTKLPDGAKFCSNCGAPTSQQGISQLSTETSISGASKSEYEYIAQCRKALLSQAQWIEEHGVPESLQDIENAPGDFAVLMAKRLDIWKNLTDNQIEQFVAMDNFSDEDKDLLRNKPMLFFTYLKLLMNIGEGFKPPRLLHGAFEQMAILFYEKLLQEYAKENKWHDYDRIAMDYLESAERANVPWLLASALELAAAGKYMLGDKRTTRTLLNRFDQVLSTTYRVRPSYTSLDEGTLLRSLKSAQEQAAQLRRMV
ncbi:MAG: zinc-ribbon domain-containing protein [Chloroflexi bacterium]|nr:zinc-ribbon domain-containing protein [Chloroflexota bacterium]